MKTQLVALLLYKFSFQPTKKRERENKKNKLCSLSNRYLQTHIYSQYNKKKMAHAPSLSIPAILTMSSVAVLYGLIKSPLKYKWAAESRISPKSDLAFRNSAEKWLEDHKGERY